MVDQHRDALFNSFYGGYVGGGGALPPPVVLNNDFWDDHKINTTVTVRYIELHLNDTQRLKLTQPLDGGLTDCTYGEWILERAKKLFLILTELGASDWIFNLIDQSWSDDDLPLSAECLAKMDLGPSLEKKFAKKQHLYLLRDLNSGSHVDYEEYEHVPIEVIIQPGAASPAPMEKVYFPRQRDKFFTRRRIPLGDNMGEVSEHTFMAEISRMKSLSHPNIVGIHSTYTYQECGYILHTPTLEATLKSFLIYPTAHFRALPRPSQKKTLLTWLHQLASALYFLHINGITHSDLRPSTITVDTSTSALLLTDLGTLPRPGNADPKETYEYSPPELHPAPLRHPLTPPHSPISQRRPDEKPLVFTLSAIFLSILTFYAKHKATQFASHRTHNRDSSFHANLPAVDTWIVKLATRAEKKGDQELLRALRVTRRGLSRFPEERGGLEWTVREVGGLDEEVERLGLLGGWETEQPGFRGSLVGSLGESVSGSWSGSSADGSMRDTGRREVPEDGRPESGAGIGEAVSKSEGGWLKRYTMFGGPR